MITKKPLIKFAPDLNIPKFTVNNCQLNFPIQILITALSCSPTVQQSWRKGLQLFMKMLVFVHFGSFVQLDYTILYIHSTNLNQISHKGSLCRKQP